MLTLDPVDGPECPRCGCRDSVAVARAKRWGVSVARLQCTLCGQKFYEQAVVYPVLKCPKCKSRKVPVKSTRKGTRYHKCEECAHSFKSQEQA